MEVPDEYDFDAAEEAAYEAMMEQEQRQSDF